MKWFALSVLTLMLGIHLDILEALLLNEDYRDDLYETNRIRKEEGIVDDLPVLDGRILRDMQQEVTNMSTASPFVGGSQEDEEWIEEAIKDIAYYLRAHKFNEYDRRYETDASKAKRSYHAGFPRPPLRNLHWEVHRFCDESFLVCIRYLWRRVQEAGLRRGDDTAVVIQEQHWKLDENREQIAIVDAECRKLRDRDDIRADPFQGPLERFQWRTTASYFMCWYTMNEVEHLRHITENCDNFANCLDPTLGPRHRDFRANDDTPFACALYSFCPDPCCHMRYSRTPDECWESSGNNPCYMSSPMDSRHCSLNRTHNIDFTSLILNYWNVSCVCPLMGYRWDSRYGICVDIDECQLGTHKCHQLDGEACMNTPGGHKCVCKWGHTWNATLGRCMLSEAIAQIKLSTLKLQVSTDYEDATVERSYIRRLYKYLKRKLGAKSDAGTVPVMGISYGSVVVPLLVMHAWP